MNIVRIALATILIVGFIGMIPRSWSRADSHTETPAANESITNMSGEELCEEKNYRSFEKCMTPCMRNKENAAKALDRYGESKTFEGADRTFLYCSERCNARTDRIDCSESDLSSLVEGTRCKAQKNNQREINKLWEAYRKAPDPNPFIAAKESREVELKRFIDSLEKVGIDKVKLQSKIDGLQNEINELEREIKKHRDYINQILYKIGQLTQRATEQDSCVQEIKNNPDRSAINQLKTFGKGGLLLRIDENSTLTIVVIPKIVQRQLQEIQVANGNLAAQVNEEAASRRQSLYPDPEDIKEVRTVLNEITQIKEARRYLQQAYTAFPMEKDLEHQRSELSNLNNYFEILDEEFSAAQLWLHWAVNTGDRDEIGIQNEIKRRSDIFLEKTSTRTMIEIRKRFPHFNFRKAMREYLTQLNYDPLKQFVRYTKYSVKDN